MSFNFAVLFVPLIIFFIPIFDTVLVSFFRFKKKRSIFLGSRDHFALRMLSMGLSQKEVLFRVASAMIILSFLAYLVTRVSFAYAVILYVLILIISFFIAMWLSIVEVD